MSIELSDNQRGFIEAYQGVKDVHIASEKANFALSWCAKERPEDYYVYGIVDPITNELFYIGKGKGRRWSSHSAMARHQHKDVNERKFKRLIAIHDAGFYDVPVLNLGHGLTEDKALHLEGQFIKALSDLLVNSTPWKRSIEWAKKAKLKRLEHTKLNILKGMGRDISTIAMIEKLVANRMPITTEESDLFGNVQKLIIEASKEAIYASTQEHKA